MGPEGFRRCDGFTGSIPQNFINSNMPTCPLCGSPDPYWTLKDKMEWTNHRILFRCKDCTGVLSATQDDFTGRTKSTAYAAITTAGLVNAIVKKNQGKDVKTVYMKVEDSGMFQPNSPLVGQELPIEEFQRMAAMYSAPAAPQPFAPAPHLTQLDPSQVQVSYGESQPAEQPRPRFCTKCGKPTTPGAAFCTGCGNRLG